MLLNKNNLALTLCYDILDDENRTLSTGLYGEALPMYESRKEPRIKNYLVNKKASNESYLAAVGQKVVSLF